LLEVLSAQIEGQLMRKLGFILASLIVLSSSVTAQAEEKSKAGKWASTNDYPAKALREGREGTVHYAVIVGVDGRVKSCTVVVSSGHADLDQAACSNITARARFEPARDANGNPIEFGYSNKFEFRIPD
jgi:protein TonB